MITHGVHGGHGAAVISLFTWKESVNDVVRASRPLIEQLLTGVSSGRDAHTTFNLQFVLWLRALARAVISAFSAVKFHNINVISGAGYTSLHPHPWREAGFRQHRSGLHDISTFAAVRRK